MLTLNLGHLAREGSSVVQGSLSGNDDFWKDSGFSWVGALVADLRAMYAGSGEVVVRGPARGVLRQDCRRCLDSVETPFARDLTMVFVAGPSGDEDNGGVYPLEPEGEELDLSQAVREEVTLAVNPYVECDPKCRGLCPRCGTNLNREVCACTDDEVDPRWAALRDLKSE
jgi:uncharacterized protein